MKRTFTSLVLGLALLVGGGGVGLAQNFDVGVAAYNRGDYATAFREFSVLAEQGDAIAQFNLGMMYSLGQGVTQDYREAARWFRLAAEQGDVRAQFNLGATYERGRGVTQDYREAMRWYRLAAEQGYADAQQKLGWMYFWAKGVTQNYVFAHMWFNIAASIGDENALANRDHLAENMTTEQVVRAQELAKQCVAKNYKGC